MQFFNYEPNLNDLNKNIRKSRTKLYLLKSAIEIQELRIILFEHTKFFFVL